MLKRPSQKLMALELRAPSGSSDPEPMFNPALSTRPSVGIAVPDPAMDYQRLSHLAPMWEATLESLRKSNPELLEKAAHKLRHPASPLQKKLLAALRMGSPLYLTPELLEMASDGNLEWEPVTATSVPSPEEILAGMLQL